jgi:hypothetical protein
LSVKIAKSCRYRVRQSGHHSRALFGVAFFDLTGITAIRVDFGADMSGDEVSLAMTIPLDSDGFLRRECPTCEREFKWRPSEAEAEEDADSADDVAYFCPYCGVQAPADAWLTQAQLALAENIVDRQVIAPMVSKLGAYESPDKLDPLTETDDMTLIVFPCHPPEPLKVLDDWHKPVHCLICGKLAS